MRKGGGERAFLASGLSKKRLTVEPFRVKLLLEVVGFFPFYEISLILPSCMSR